jgi:hypothetical protein
VGLVVVNSFEDDKLRIEMSLRCRTCPTRRPPVSVVLEYRADGGGTGVCEVVAFRLLGELEKSVERH